MIDLMQEQIDDLMGRLRRGERQEQERAACSLARIGARAVPKVMRALEDPDWRVRRHAALVFMMAPHPRAVPLLCELSGELDWEVRWAAVAALKATVDPLSTDALVQRLADVHPKVRALAAEALLLLRDTGSNLRPHLSGDSICLSQAAIGLQDPDPRVRRAAVMVLGCLDGPRMAPGLKAALASDEPLVAAEAARALGRLAIEEALEPLLRVLQVHTDGRVQCAACTALGQIGGEEVIVGLAGALRARSTEVRRTAALELSRLAKESPSVSLLAAIANLRWCLAQGWWIGDDDAAIYAEAIQSIERATRTLRDLPVPSGGNSGIHLLPVPITVEHTASFQDGFTSHTKTAATGSRRDRGLRRWLQNRWDRWCRIRR